MRNNEEKYEKEDYTMRYLGCIKQIAMHRAAFSPSSCVQSKLRSAPLAEHSVPSHPSQTKTPQNAGSRNWNSSPRACQSFPPGNKSQTRKAFISCGFLSGARFCSFALRETLCGYRPCRETIPQSKKAYSSDFTALVVDSHRRRCRY